MGQYPGANPAMFPNRFPLATGQATRHARQVYVGGLPPTANEQSIATFFSKVMAAIGGNTAGPGDSVVNVCINHEKKLAYVEMRSMEEASNVLALDGIIFEGAPVKVSRPGDYNPSLAATLSPSQPNPKLNMAAVGLMPGSTGGLDGPADHIFVGGLPYDFTEAHLRTLLESFGPLHCFDLIQDRETGKSKGYALCLYQDLSVTDIACAALNGIKVGDMTLTVRRANQGANQPKPEQESVLLHAKQQIALQGAPVKVSRPADYNPSLAATLGPSQPNPKLNMAAVGLTPGSAGALDGPADHIFVGGLPYDFTEAHLRKLLESFGPLHCLDLIRDRETGKSKGYALCLYQDLSATDIACAALNGIKVGDMTLTVRRENQGANQPKPEQESVLLRAKQQIALQGAPVKVSRPGDYNASLAATLGPSQPNPKLNMAAVGLMPGSAGGVDGPADHIFVGGLPYDFTEAHIRKLLEPFGPLRCFDLIKDRQTGKSKDYALCLFQDLSVTDIACAALNGIKVGDTTLTVRRANQGANQPEQESVLLHAKQQIALEGAPVKVSRPSDYNPSLAATLGPSQSNSKLNMAAVGLTPGSAGDLEGPADHIFVGGFPYYFTETQIRELLETFGPLRHFEVIRDGETAKSKGYALCVYQDLSVTYIACAALNGIKMGDMTLTVRLENQNTNQLKLEEESISLQSALQRLMLQPGSVASKVLCFSQVVTAEKLKDDEEYYEHILEDMRQVGKLGTLVNVVIPQPNPNGEPSPGVGKVFLEYADIHGAIDAQTWLNGRKFGGNQVVAVFYPENKFVQGDYEG